MSTFHYSIITWIIFLLLASCEEVVEIDLKYADPAFVVEATIYYDSVCTVRLTQTVSYFSTGGPQFVEDASIIINDGVSSEELTYRGNGYYEGETIIGTQKSNYQLEILHNGTIYKGISYMPSKTNIISIQTFKSESHTIFNPQGKTVFTINCQFGDEPGIDNYYMICYISNGRLIEDRYFLLTENNANGGSFNNTNNLINFSESIFFEGGEVAVQLFSIDKSVYDYFIQLDDVLFWKRRALPPTPYNPISNINYGVLGYFAAWTFDSKKVLLE